MIKYFSRIGDTGIYTSQGDWVGSIENEAERDRAIEGLNGQTIDNDEYDKFQTYKDLDLSPAEIQARFEKYEQIDAQIDDQVQEAITSLEFLADCALVENFGPDQYGLIKAAIDRLKAIGLPPSP